MVDQVKAELTPIFRQVPGQIKMEPIGGLPVGQGRSGTAPKWARHFPTVILFPGGM